MNIENLWTSEEFDAVMSGLFEFQQKVKPVVKESVNPGFRSKYADLAAIQEEIAEPLRESGLIYSQSPVGRGEVVTILSHVESGQWLMSRLDLVPDNATAQQSGSAITYAKRYALCSILGLRLDSDDDGNAASSATQTKMQAKVRDEKVATATKANEAREAKHKLEPREAFKALMEKLAQVEPAKGDAVRWINKVLGANGFESAEQLFSAPHSKQTEIYKEIQTVEKPWKEKAALELQPADA